MPQLTKRQSTAHRLNQSKASVSDDDQNGRPDSTLPPASISTRYPKKPKKTLTVQVAEKESRIMELEATVSELSADLLCLQTTHDTLSLQHLSLLAQRRDLSMANQSLNNLKRKATTAFNEELSKKRKRIRRLELERDTNKDNHTMTLESLRNDLRDSTVHITRL